MKQFNKSTFRIEDYQHLAIEGHEPNLIPGEGIRRSAGSLADEAQTLEEMFSELDRIRHPERCEL